MPNQDSKNPRVYSGSINILETIQASVEQVLAVDPTALELDQHIVRDLDADSLEMAELAMVLEERLGIEIPDEAASTLVTVGDWLEYLTRRTSGKNATVTDDEASNL